MRIVIANSSPDPIYEQIARQVKQQVLAGELAEGAPLPSIRALARDLQVSVITTKRAYEELEREGFIDTVGGKGTFVAMQNPTFLREQRLRAVEAALVEAVERARLLGIGRDDLIEMVRLLCEETS
jgi:GntR family transcriptional regulator